MTTKEQEAWRWTGKCPECGANIEAAEECGCCEQYHPASYGGDCRNDSVRFSEPEFCPKCLWRVDNDRERT